MTPAFSTLIARAQAKEPHKSYSQLCSELARRPRRREERAVQKKVEYWYNKD